MARKRSFAEYQGRGFKILVEDGVATFRGRDQTTYSVKGTGVDETIEYGRKTFRIPPDCGSLYVEGTHPLGGAVPFMNTPGEHVTL